MRLAHKTVRVLVGLVWVVWSGAVSAQNPVLFSGENCLIFDSSAPAGPDAGDSHWCGQVVNGNLVFEQLTQDPSPSAPFLNSQALSGDSITLLWANNGNQQILRPQSLTGFTPSINPAHFFTMVADIAALTVRVFYDDPNMPAGAGALCLLQGNPAMAILFENVEPYFVLNFGLQYYPDAQTATHLVVPGTTLPYFPNFPDLYIPVDANGGNPMGTVVAGSFNQSATLEDLGTCPTSFEIGTPPPGFGPQGGARLRAPVVRSWHLTALCLALLVGGGWVLGRRDAFNDSLPMR